MILLRNGSCQAHLWFPSVVLSAVIMTLHRGGSFAHIVGSSSVCASLNQMLLPPWMFQFDTMCRVILTRASSSNGSAPYSSLRARLYSIVRNLPVQTCTWIPSGQPDAALRSHLGYAHLTDLFSIARSNDSNGPSEASTDPPIFSSATTDAAYVEFFAMSCLFSKTVPTSAPPSTSPLLSESPFQFQVTGSGLITHMLF